MMIYNIIALGYLMYSLPDMYRALIDMFKRKTSFIDVFSCGKCLSFWVVLIASQSLVYALLVSLVVFLLDSFVTTKL